jgi:hypothetical protein
MSRNSKIPNRDNNQSSEHPPSDEQRQSRFGTPVINGLLRRTTKQPTQQEEQAPPDPAAFEDVRNYLNMTVEEREHLSNGQLRKEYFNFWVCYERRNEINVRDSPLSAAREKARINEGFSADDFAFLVYDLLCEECVACHALRSVSAKARQMVSDLEGRGGELGI